MSLTIAAVPSLEELEAASWPEPFTTARRDASGYPCLDDQRHYTPGLCASCTVERCWTGLPLNQAAIPARIAIRELPRHGDLAAQCRGCARVADVSSPGGHDATPTVWCERWHWQAPITEYELAQGFVPEKAGAVCPCPDFVPAAELRPAVAAVREADRVRSRLRRARKTATRRARKAKAA